jgi:hypothetical protein
LGAKGIRTIFYIGDILILGSSYNICLEHTLEAIHLLINAGEVQPHSIDELPVSGVPVEHSASVSGRVC